MWNIDTDEIPFDDIELLEDLEEDDEEWGDDDED